MFGSSLLWWWGTACLAACCAVSRAVCALSLVEAAMHVHVAIYILTAPYLASACSLFLPASTRRGCPAVVGLALLLAAYHKSSVMLGSAASHCHVSIRALLYMVGLLD